MRLVRLPSFYNLRTTFRTVLLYNLWVQGLMGIPGLQGPIGRNGTPGVDVSLKINHLISIEGFLEPCWKFRIIGLGI